MSIQRLSNAGQSGYRYKSLIAGITPVASIPVIGEATALTFSTASVTFTAPGAYAGSTFTATSSPGGLTGTSATSPITVSGLSENTAYTFTVTATNATGTSSASAASSSITTPTAFTPEGAYDALATVTVPSGGAATIEFVGIPTGYKHLQLRGIAKSTGGGTEDFKMQLNGVTSGYAVHGLYGTGAGSGASNSGTSQTSIVQPYNFAVYSGGTSIFGAVIYDILDYSNVSKYKTVRTLGGADVNGSGTVGLYSGLWQDTSAVTSIKLFATSNNLAQYSQFALYGVK